MALAIDLTGRLTLVTGGTSQLGRVMVRTLADCGADLAIHYHQNKSGAQKLCAEVEERGRRALAVQADVGELKSVMGMRDAIQEALGDPDIVVTNAVSQITWHTVLEEDPKNYEGQFRTCVLQNVHLAKAFIPAMIRRRVGRFIGINTECTMQLKPTQSAYASAKRGMDGVLRVLAREVGEHQITVNQVAPGWTISDRDREQGTQRNEGYEATVPLKRRGTDQEIANVVAFLASGLASFISGAYLPVCGGNVMPTV
ncbi:MAG: SDR family oxidoreductase [Candidatus Latescibacteria bacterium]|nr:SDR family oxidoreductase [Candidatus Latescibacterota bacterium]